MTTGCPFDVTRVAATTHCPVIHGDGAPDTLNGHPAIAYGAAIVTVGCPLTSTRGLGEVGVAVPACAQSTVAPTCRSGPGIASYTTTSAPAFTVTDGPVMTMLAPLPFWM